ncbi:MAG: hypothetical protein QOJ51_3081 [Acidobacteriaceae bacterium]|jgi:hypothetical protein|nr:hypothetical protein [Acidobacteriaceae bacterium]
MPKNTVTDTITDQEMAFAHLIMSGTMNDRRAAEAVGLNPETAAYTKSKPRVRAYMNEHRAAVREKLVDQEAEGLRKLNFGRAQILARLWELATLSPEATRGSIAGQIKAMSMIVAIEGLIPDRRSSPSGTQPAAQPIQADIYPSAWRHEQQHQPEGDELGDPVAATEAQPAAPQVPDLEPAPNPAPTPANDAPADRILDRNQSAPAAPLIAHALNRVPLAEDNGFHALLDTRQPFSIQKGPFNRRR